MTTRRRHWKRVCRRSDTTCPDRQGPISGSAGITSLACCVRALCESCPHRESLSLAEFSHRLPGLDFIAAHYRLGDLSICPQNRLYDLLPAVLGPEIPILFTWCAEFTARKIPWAVEMRDPGGYVLSLWKCRRA